MINSTATRTSVLFHAHIRVIYWNNSMLPSGGIMVICVNTVHPAHPASRSSKNSCRFRLLLKKWNKG